MGWFWAVWRSWVVLICCGRQAAGLRGALLLMGAGGGGWLLL